MSNWGFIVIGWSATGGVLAAYATRVLLRGRALSRQVPAGRRRWMQ